MVQEEKHEKVTVKKKPLGGTEVEKTEQRVVEEPSTAQPSRAQDVASKGGAAIGTGLKKVGKVIEEFTAGVSKEMKSGEPSGQEQVPETRQAEYRSERTEQVQEAPRAKVTKKEKVEQVTKEE